MPGNRMGNAPLVYEVRLAVDPAIVPAFDHWLEGHVRDMIALPGFYDARVIQADPGPDGRARRLIRYRLRDRAALDTYLERHAEAMRRDGIERFGDGFAAERDIYPAATGDDTAGQHHCPNCGAAAGGPFCPSCGQEQKDIHVSFGRLVLDFLGDIFTFDSRLARSLRPLLFRPGFLTREYFLGRRTRYIPPLRLYLFVSIVFFGLLSLVMSEPQVAAYSADTPEGSPVTREEADAVRAIPRTETGRDQAAKELSSGADRSEVPVGVELDAGALPWITPKMAARLEERGRMAGESPERFARYLFENLPVMMFLLLPVYALVLRLLYPMAGYIYLEHLIFSLHVHAFTFLGLTFLLVAGMLGDWLAPAPSGWPRHLGTAGYTFLICYALAYPWLAMRRTYRQGLLLTTLKYLLQALIYLALLVLGIGIASLATLFWF